MGWKLALSELHKSGKRRQPERLRDQPRLNRPKPQGIESQLSMKLFQAAKRVSLFIAVNFLVILTLTLVLRLTGLDRRFTPETFYGLMGFCLIWGMGGAFISLALSRVMAKWFMGVRLIEPGAAEPALREVVEMVHALARRADLPAMPQVGYFESAEVNAFATGPSKSRSLVAVSTGLLRRMNRGEIEGVLAHEVAHIANGDMVTMTLIQGIINAFVMFLARILAFVVAQALRSRDDRGGGWLQFALVFVFQMLLSLLGAVVVCWFSRWREFRADAGGAALSSRGNMAGALRALQRVYEQQAHPQPAEGQSAAFQSLKISGRSSGLMQLFATHPPLEQRIARLEAGQ
jgi:heat shock protein HtpX